MKTKIFCIITALALITLCSCGEKEDFTLSGAYWNEDYRNVGVTAIEEEINYKVTSVSKGEFTSSELSSDGLALKIDGTSSYKTKLTVEDGKYVYETTLKIDGSYVYEGGEYPIINDLTYTKTVFGGVGDRLFPVSSYRKAENVCARKEKPTGEDDFKRICYEMTVTYGETAQIFITPSDDSLNYFNGVSFEVKDYKDGTFFDEDEMVFAFRAVKTEKGKAYYFNSIDALSGELKQLSVTDGTSAASSSSEETDAITPIQVKQYFENGNLSDKKDFNCVLAKFSTTGTYGKTFKYVYYAVNPTSSEGAEINSARRIPVKIYQPQLFNKGYLCFTVDEYKVSYNG